MSYALAPHATRVTAADLSADMLAAVAAKAREKGFANITTVETAAERLPFADADFDFLACRYSAHHWQDFAGGLGQARRVLKARAPAVFIDAFSPGQLSSTRICRPWSCSETPRMCATTAWANGPLR